MEPGGLLLVMPTISVPYASDNHLKPIASILRRWLLPWDFFALAYVPMPRDRYLEPYRQACDAFGDTFEVTLWASRHSQIRRFEVMAQLQDLNAKRVLDAGCSRGDFAAFLVERGIDYASYIGVDGLAQIIAHAQSRNLRSAEFHYGDFLQDPALLRISDPQVICISGALNTMTDRQVDRVLSACWTATQQVLLFNFLSDLAEPHAPAQTSPARRCDTLKLLRWACSQTGSVIYRQDYLRFGHDATIMMSKERSGAEGLKAGACVSSCT